MIASVLPVSHVVDALRLLCVVGLGIAVLMFGLLTVIRRRGVRHRSPRWARAENGHGRTGSGVHRG